MSYVNVDQLISRFGENEIRQLSDHGNTGDIDQQVVDTAINDAAAEIDSYLVERYPTPLATTPQRITDIAASLVLCRLYIHDMPEQVANTCKEARRWLEGVAAGKWSVPGLAESANAEAVAAPQSSAPGRLFTRDTLKDF